MILAIFNREPVFEQPTYVADMGCGDGIFLARVHQVVRDKSLRGRMLQNHPLTLIGVDYNAQALAATARTLKAIPHLLFHGDIGDPESLVGEFKARGIDPGEVLHIRSFLDHNRPFHAPVHQTGIERRWSLDYSGVYVDEKGGSIPAPALVQNLVEHLQRWAGIVGKYGLILLEVHCLPPRMVDLFLDQCENLQFDACHGFSRQYLVEADTFLMAAAEAGLFPKPEFFHRYPETLPFSRITLNWLEKRDYRLRHAYGGDVPGLVELEAACWPEPLRLLPLEIRRRIECFPEGQFLLELDAEIVGVLYSQMIERADSLADITFEQVSSLHCGQGTVLQLLNVNILPDVQNMGLGDQLLDFVLSWITLKGGVEKVVGVTRCKDFMHSALPMPEYIRQHNEQGGLIDPTLHFHTSHGAVIKGLVPRYRPTDADNQGYGVCIEYDLSRHRRAPATQSEIHQPAAADAPSVMETVATAVRTALGARREGAYAPNRALMDMGLDSLDLLALRVNLGRKLNASLDSTFFFRCSTPDAITAHFQGKPLLEAARAGGTVPWATPAKAPEPPHARANREILPDEADAPTVQKRTLRTVNVFRWLV